MNKNELLGNLTSTVKTILLAFAGYFLGYLVSIGLDLPISAEQLAEILFMILCLAWSYLDMKYPHAFKHFKNNTHVVETEEDLINQEYISEDDGC